MLQQINAQVSVVTADIGYPVSRADKAAAGKQAIGKGEFHWIPPEVELQKEGSCPWQPPIR